MFAYLKGYVAYSGKDFVVIDVNGVGYKVYKLIRMNLKKRKLFKCLLIKSYQKMI